MAGFIKFYAYQLLNDNFHLECCKELTEAA